MDPSESPAKSRKSGETARVPRVEAPTGRATFALVGIVSGGDAQRAVGGADETLEPSGKVADTGAVLR